MKALPLLATLSFTIAPVPTVEEALQAAYDYLASPEGKPDPRPDLARALWSRYETNPAETQAACGAVALLFSAGDEEEAYARAESLPLASPAWRGVMAELYAAAHKTKNFDRFENLAVRLDHPQADGEARAIAWQKRALILLDHRQNKSEGSRALDRVIALAGGGRLGRWAAAKKKELEDSSRDHWQMPDKVLAALEVSPGATVADVGAGGGYFSRRLARAVGPEGTVYAEDIDPYEVETFRVEAKNQGLDQIRTVLGEPDDPKLPAGEIDLILMVDTYHEVTRKDALLVALAGALKPAGRLAIIDRFSHGCWDEREDHEAVPGEVARRAGRAAFKLAETHHFLPYQFFLVFEKGNASLHSGRDRRANPFPALAVTLK